MTGNPSSAAACCFSPFGPTTGKVTTVVAGDSGCSSFPQAATPKPMAAASDSAASGRARSMADNLTTGAQRPVQDGYRAAADEDAVAGDLDAEHARARRRLLRAQRAAPQPLLPVGGERGVRAAGDMVLGEPVAGGEEARDEVEAAAVVARGGRG